MSDSSSCSSSRNSAE